MKNFIKNISIILILILIYYKRPLVMSAIINGFNLWKTVVFPSIFPIMIISDYILSTDLIVIISNLIGPLFSKIFKVSKYSSYIFFMSVISGCPSNAKYIKDLLQQNVITNKEAEKILAMSLVYNPILIISITSFLKLKDSIYLIFINIIINLIIGLINRNYRCEILNNSFKKKKFILIDSISNSMNILLLILGSIITFITINSILPIHHPLISGIMEITNGINLIHYYNIPYQYKMIFSGLLMSFGGLSILYQIKSIFKDTLVNYTLFYKSRIIHLLLMLTFIHLLY